MADLVDNAPAEIWVAATDSYLSEITVAGTFSTKDECVDFCNRVVSLTGCVWIPKLVLGPRGWELRSRGELNASRP